MATGWFIALERGILLASWRADTIERALELSNVLLDRLFGIHNEVRLSDGFPRISRTEDMLPVELVPVRDFSSSALDARAVEGDVVALRQNEEEAGRLFLSQSAALRDL
jgi:hypothetical protein